MKNIILFLLLCQAVSCSQPKKAAEICILEEVPAEPFPIKESELEQIVPPGYTIVENDHGQELQYSDLNGDGRLDVALLMQMRGDEDYDYAEEVLLLIAHGLPGGYLEIAAISEHLGGESISYTNNKHLNLNGQVITYWHESMRHEAYLHFLYDAQKEDYLLSRIDYQESGSIDEGPRKVEIDFLTGTKTIQESAWNDQTEETEPLPIRKSPLEVAPILLSEMNLDGIYELL